MSRAQALSVVLGVTLVAATGWVAVPAALQSQGRRDMLSHDPEQARGFVSKVFLDAEGEAHRYLVFVPYQHQHGERRPVLLCLNGFGENGNDGFNQIVRNPGPQLWERRDSLPFIVVAPQCRGNGSWTPGSPDVTWALAILDEVIKEYGADPDRVCLTGVSAGGTGAWAVAAAHPDRFAAVVPLCGFGSGAAELAASQLPIWNHYNEGDLANLVDANRDFRASLIKLGASPLVSEFHQGTHNCWDRTYRDPAVYAWLLKQSRQRNRAQRATPFRCILPRELLASWQVSGSGAWTPGDENTLIGSRGTEDGQDCLYSDCDLGDFDFHVDVRFDQTACCRIGLLTCSDPVERQGVLLNVCHADRGTGGARVDGGADLGRLSPDAQLALDPDGWNDLRVRRLRGRVTLEINGRPALELSNPVPPGSLCRIALYVEPGESQTQWRFIRLRALNPSSQVDHEIPSTDIH